MTPPMPSGSSRLVCFRRFLDLHVLLLHLDGSDNNDNDHDCHHGCDSLT